MTVYARVENEAPQDDDINTDHDDNDEAMGNNMEDEKVTTIIPTDHHPNVVVNQARRLLYLSHLVSQFSECYAFLTNVDQIKEQF